MLETEHKRSLSRSYFEPHASLYEKKMHMCKPSHKFLLSNISSGPEYNV